MKTATYEWREERKKKEVSCCFCGRDAVEIVAL